MPPPSMAVGGSSRGVLTRASTSRNLPVHSTSSRNVLGATSSKPDTDAADGTGLVKTRHSMRAQRLTRAATSTALELDSTSSWRYAGKLAAQADMVHVTRRALARHQLLRDALSKSLENERVDTPQWAAGRELPVRGAVPEVPAGIEEAVEEATLTLRYWAPPHAVAKMPHYIFHEPGKQVRESLLALEELRGRGGRGRLEARYRDEVMRARRHAAAMVHEQDIDQEAGKAASTVQRAWRDRERAPPGELEVHAELGSCAGSEDVEQDRC